MSGGGLMGNVSPYYAAIGHIASHKNNSCYFDPKKMTDQREWTRKLMDKKEVACKEEKLRWTTAKTVVHTYPIKEPLLYEASLRCIPTLSYILTPYSPRILPQQDRGIVESGATQLYISPSAPHVPPDTSASKISVVTADRRVEKLPATAILPIPQLASYFPTTVFIIPSFANTLVGVRIICDADCTLVFTKQDVTLFSPKVKPILTCWRENKLLSWFQSY